MISRSNFRPFYSRTLFGRLRDFFSSSFYIWLVIHLWNFRVNRLFCSAKNILSKNFVRATKYTKMFGLLSSLFWHIDNEHLLSRLKAAMVSLKTSATEDNFFLIIWNFVVKNLCDKISKMKNLSRQFCWIFHWLSRGVLHFFWGCCFHGEICKTKWPLFDFLEKTEKSRFWTSNFSIKTAPN